MNNAVSVVGILILLATVGPGKSPYLTKSARANSDVKDLAANTRCKTFLNGGKKYKLCVDGARGSLTGLSNSGQINFVLDQCVPNSSRYVASYTEENGGVALAIYRLAIWDYCNKGWNW